ncbi:alpha/beta hydrolase [Glaciimonas sp. CA11.2]|uniref:esterase/lipase family protein n=1 Tax=Glaciimonas sp. CA11.2 TaxID=3048601 RepID=UPI002AB3BF80|nr:alpha/beta hydrolase [Glaciimonas sp. CA11.2]MDY7546990.1 alpha/beta hydrolase [Glaciimonas sp. CA11.2]MEB0164094.1 alpha/beta hydrolase [Glaciimonas sp. CA11.2]
MDADHAAITDKSATKVRAILVHGMGRTPLSMLILAARLRAAGLRPALFGYSAAFERWDPCVKKLHHYLARNVAGQRYIVIGHSLGCLLTLAALPDMVQQPEACFFLAPPMQASQMARTFSRWRLFKLMTGEIGQFLGQQDWTRQLPIPAVPTTIYAGSAGPRGRWSPFGGEANDGILTVSETQMANIPSIVVPSLHTTIMNSRRVCDDIVAKVNNKKFVE